MLLIYMYIIIYIHKYIMLYTQFEVPHNSILIILRKMGNQLLKNYEHVNYRNKNRHPIIGYY